MKVFSPYLGMSLAQWATNGRVSCAAEGLPISGGAAMLRGRSLSYVNIVQNGRIGDLAKRGGLCY